MHSRLYPCRTSHCLAALLFGASAPLSKLLFGEVKPVPLAAFLYLGSGTGGFPDALLPGIAKQRTGGGSPSQPQRPALAGRSTAGRWNRRADHPATGTGADACFDSFAAAQFRRVWPPRSLQYTFFKESIDRRIAWAIGLVTLASIVLTWTGGNWGITLGALGVIGACFLWGLDNNFTRHISAKNPLVIVGSRDWGQELFRWSSACCIRQQLPMPQISCPAGNAVGINQLWNQHPIIHCCHAIHGSGTHQHPVRNRAHSLESSFR